MSGRSILIFLPDGSSSGLRIAGLGLSTITCVVSPREMLTALAKRDEPSRTGLYFLTGPDPESSASVLVYVGEGDDVLSRLKEHNKDESKGWWDTAYIFVSKDQSLTKAHVRWLEARSVANLRAAKRSNVKNSNNPAAGNLPESDQAEMEEFLGQVELLLPTLGFRGFEPVIATTLVSSQSRSDQVEFSFSGTGYSATGHLADGNFVVLAGAEVRLRETDTLPDSSRAVRTALMENVVLADRGDSYELVQDYSFNSSSQAAEVVCGFSISGRAAWKTDAGQTLGEWQDEALGEGARGANT